MMVLLFYSLFFVFVIFYVMNFDYFSKFTRFSAITTKISVFIKQMLSYRSSFWVLYILFVSLFMINLLGNIPLSSIPSLFYSQTLTLSLMFWIPIMFCVSITQLKDFVAHMLPYGSPAGLMLILPLIEIFSQLIRPFTLMIRLSTNLSSGHIMLYIFSYFTLLSDSLVFLIVPILMVLYVLEICISMLQAYIFVTLLSLYIAETNH